MNTRPLSREESDNLTALNEAGLQSTLLFVTATGLGKGILDATDPMRMMLLKFGIHDYAIQQQGEDAKRLLSGIILDETGTHDVQISLYRPNTKKGDPRMWFYQMTKYAKPDDVLAVFVMGKIIYAINLTRTPLAATKGTSSVLDRFFEPLWIKSYSVANELLELLKSVASKGPLKAVCEGDTAIGRSIETALGIMSNSSKKPDYKGIEIKSARSQKNRTTLFACVPDWNLSTLKSSAEILNCYGYKRLNDFSLYCTVTTRQPNPRGLLLTIDEAQRWLKEIAVKLKVEKQVVVWRLAKLEERLSQKHRETFWIKAIPEMLNKKEYFHLRSVTHTRNPNLPQLERLLADGTITLDHLISREADGKVTEKGPLFRINSGRVRELFLGEPKEYSLVS